MVVDHTHKTHPSDCFKCCEHCSGWRVEVSCHQGDKKGNMEKTDKKNGSICYNYNSPVTNNYYTLPMAPPTATPTTGLTTPTCSSRDSPLFTSSLQCSNVASDSNVGSRVLLESDDRSHDLKHKKNPTETCSEREKGTRIALSRKSTFTNGSAVHPTQCVRSLSDSSITLRQRCCVEECSHKGRSLVEPTPKSCSEDKGDKLREMANRLFDVFPYNYLKRNYRGLRKEIIRSLLVVFFIYQAMAATLMTVCEDGGFRAVFHSGEQNRYPEIVNRLLKFSIKIVFRVILPLCCTVHLPILATTPLIPKTNLSKHEALVGLMRIHKQFSSEEEIAFLRERPETIIAMSEEMTKRRIRSMWITVTHSVLLVLLGVYLGAFYVCEQNTMKGGVCKFLSVTIVRVPFLDFNVHLLIAIESLSFVVILLIYGIVGDCYNYENRIATYATIIGGNAKKLFKEIRRRWVVMDRLVHIMPLVKAAILALSISTGRPFVSMPVHIVQASDLVDWYFWIMILTVLFLLGTSSNRMAKKASIGGYVIAAILIFTVQVETSHIPYGSIMVLLYTVMSAYILNHLYCLGRCYYSNIGSCLGWFPFLTIVGLVLILVISVAITIFREVTLLSSFVTW